MNPRDSLPRRGRILVIASIATTMLLPPIAADANHLAPGDYAATTVFPTVTSQPAAVTTTLTAGTALPVYVEFHMPTGHEFAHADSVAGVPASPITPRPADEDIVAQLVAVGDFALDGCSGAGDTSVPDQIPLVGFWNEPWEGAAVTGKVAEMKVPTSQFPLYGSLVLSTGHTGQTSAHYDLQVVVPIAALACAGTTLTLSTTMLDYTRRIVAITPAPTSGFPTTRIFQRHGASAGLQTNSIHYLDATNTAHDGSATYTLTARTDTTVPSGSFTGLTNGAVLTGTQQLTVAATDNIAVAKVEFGRSGRTHGTDVSAPYQATVDTTALDDGTHAFTARVADVSNNIFDLAAVNAIVDNMAPSVTFTAPVGLGSPVTATFNEPDISGVSASSFLLTLEGSATPIAGSLACATATGSAVDCATGPAKTATFTPSSPLVPGESYEASMSPAGAPTVVDAAGNIVAPTTSVFRAALANDDVSAAASPAWARSATASAFGGSYTVERLAGATATIPFTGAAIQWITVRGPAFGKARVLIDGAVNQTVNLYRAATQFHHTIVIGGLSAGAHTLRIVALGQKGNSAGTDTRVALDAVSFGGTRRDTPAATYAWRRVTASPASGGAYSIANLTGATMEFDFVGTLIDWFTVRGPAMGKAKIYVDGVLKQTVDNYASSLAYDVQRRVSGLSDAAHTVRIVVAGTKNPSSSGTSVAVDRWVVG